MPNFFEEVDGTGVVESHIKKVLKLEDAEAQQIMEHYQEIRQELVERLSRTNSQSFTAQHLRGVLAQVNGAIAAANRKLAGDMFESSFRAAKEGLHDLFKEINVFDEKFTGAVTPINLNAALVAQDTANHLVTKYKTNLDAYGTNLSAGIANGLFSATIGETSYAEVVGRIGQFFSAEQWKLHRIVRTELHNIYNVGKINGMNELAGEDGDIPDLMKTLMHPMDARTGDDSKYAATLGLVANINEPFVYIWKGQQRTFMAPPDRPNDRAILVPYRTEWGKARGAAFIPGTFPKA